MRDQSGRPVPGALPRLGAFTAVVAVLGVAGLGYGTARGGTRGAVVLVLAAVALAATAVMWAAIARTQRSRRPRG